MHSHGFTISAPPSWDVRVYRRPATLGERTYPVVHAGNFALPLQRGDFGSGAVELMGPSDVLVVLFEHDAEAATTALFQRRGMPTARAEDFSPRALQRTLRGQSGVQYFFHEGSRAFCLYIVLGSHARRRRLVPAANELVRSVAIR
jgi:hypothetical protein